MSTARHRSGWVSSPTVPNPTNSPGSPSSKYFFPKPASGSNPSNGQEDSSVSKSHVTTLMNYRPEKSSANWRSGPIQQEPPKEFSPQLVRDTDSKPQSKSLPEEVSTMMISPQTNTFQMFYQVDKHAVEISQETQSDFNQLIWQLIYARNITDDVEKVRVIFLWLCTKDLNTLQFLNVQPGSPEDMLMGIRTKRTTYAQIFLTLCQYAGVQCKIISGYAKGVGYEAGQHFTGQAFHHSWNAVLIYGIWQLIDCNWASRYVLVRSTSGPQLSVAQRLEKLCYEFDMFFFLCNPKLLIYSHFPHDADWQLLRQPVSLKEFEEMPVVKSHFFKYQLELHSHRKAVVECREEVTIKIGVEKSRLNELAFTFSLCRLDTGSEVFNGVPLKRYGKQEVVRDDLTSTFCLRLPQETNYKLVIYAKILRNTEGETPASASQTTYDGVCEYRLDARFLTNNALPPFPPCASSSYGSIQPTLSLYRVQPLCSNASLRASQGYVELAFDLLTPTSNEPPTRLLAKLKSSETQLTEDLLQRCLLLRNVTREVSCQSILSVFLPRAGEYGLEIYANEPARDGNTYSQVYQYLIVTESASSIATNLPMLPSGFLGEQEQKCSQLGVAPVNYLDPYFTCGSGNLMVQIAQAKGPLRLMCQLWSLPSPDQYSQVSTASQDCSQQVLQQVQGRNVSLIIRFPRVGYFKLQLFAAPSDRPLTENMPCVFNYLIDSGRPSSSPGAFPQQFAHWRENGYLHEPMEGELFRLGQPKILKFSLEVPHVQCVAVVVGNEWTSLHRKDPSWRWEGDVQLAQHWGRERCLSVCAKNGETTTTYNTLLTYKLA